MNATAQLIRFPFDSHQQYMLRQRLAYLIDKKKLFQAIDSDPNLIGAGVVYIDSRHTVVTLRGFEPVCSVKPIKVILREAPRSMPALEHAQDVATSPRQSKLLAEVLGATLSCGAAVLSWVVIVGSAGTIPLTAGASTALTVLSYSAFAASAVQCGNGMARVGMEGVSPAFIDAVDQNEWYSAATDALDVISLAGAAASGYITIRMVKTLQSQGVSVKKTLAGLSRAQRTRLTEEIVRINHPGASAKMIKFLKRTGGAPKRYTQAQIREATQRQLKDALGAMFSFTGSATSGIVRSMAVGIYEEVN